MNDGDDQRPTRRLSPDPLRRIGSDPGADSPTAGSGERGNRREHDSVRSKIWYGGGLGLAATVLVAIGLAALFDLSFWAALGITALIGLGLVMLLAVLVG